MQQTLHKKKYNNVNNHVRTRVTTAIHVTLLLTMPIKSVAFVVQPVHAPTKVVQQQQHHIRVSMSKNKCRTTYCPYQVRQNGRELQSHQRDEIAEKCHQATIDDTAQQQQHLIHCIGYIKQIQQQCFQIATPLILAAFIVLLPMNGMAETALAAPVDSDTTFTTNTEARSASATTSMTLASSPTNQKDQQQQPTSNVVEEVWTLIDKYYIDRTYNGLNWKTIRDKYVAQSYKSNDDTRWFQLAVDMVATLNDKYTRMLSRDQYSAIQKYDLIGVGVTLMPDSNKSMIVGAPPIPKSEAERVGMQMGDYITAINGIPTKGRTAFDIIDQISEDPSAKTVTMTIRSKDSVSETDPTNTRTVVMSRAFTEVRNPIQYKITETRPDGTKVGYIRITEFNALVKGNLEKALTELEAANVNAYVLDLRQNTGGAFQSAVEISSLFTEDRIATYVVDNTNMKLPFRTAKGQLAIDKTDPIVIIIDNRSASASEVLAGSLHDNCRAITMGPTKSFGKGLIQAVYGLKSGEGLVMTVARYITPSGNDIQGVGITPDIMIPQSGPLQNIAGTLPIGMLDNFAMDTSTIDFHTIQERLQNGCIIPPEVK